MFFAESAWQSTQTNPFCSLLHQCSILGSWSTLLQNYFVLSHLSWVAWVRCFIMFPRNCCASWSTMMAVRPWTDHFTWPPHFTHHIAIDSAGCGTEAFCRYHCACIHQYLLHYTVSVPCTVNMVVCYPGSNWRKTCIAVHYTEMLSPLRTVVEAFSPCYSSRYHCHSSGLLFCILFMCAWMGITLVIPLYMLLDKIQGARSHYLWLMPSSSNLANAPTWNILCHIPDITSSMKGCNL
jgi:hypothetical protein